MFGKRFTEYLQAIAILGIVLAIVTGQDNVFTAPEHGKGGFGGANWAHAGGHVVSMPVFITLFWLLSWPLFALTRRVAPRGGQPAGGLA